MAQTEYENAFSLDNMRKWSEKKHIEAFAKQYDKIIEAGRQLITNPNPAEQNVMHDLSELHEAVSHLMHLAIIIASNKETAARKKPYGVDQNVLGQMFRYFRKKNITQEYLAHAAGIKTVRLSNIETGKQLPTQHEMIRLSEVLDKHVNEIWETAFQYE